MSRLLTALVLTAAALSAVSPALAGQRDLVRGRGHERPFTEQGNRDSAKDRGVYADRDDDDDDDRGRRWNRGRRDRDRDNNNDNDRGRGRDHDRARDGVVRGQLAPLELVLGGIARRFPGHHLGVQGPSKAGGRLVYRIKWLTPDGRVLIVFTDAESGEILDVRGGR